MAEGNFIQRIQQLRDRMRREAVEELDVQADAARKKQLIADQAKYSLGWNDGVLRAANDPDAVKEALELRLRDYIPSYKPKNVVICLRIIWHLYRLQRS